MKNIGAAETGYLRDSIQLVKNADRMNIFIGICNSTSTCKINSQAPVDFSEALSEIGVTNPDSFNIPSTGLMVKRTGSELPKYLVFARDLETAIELLKKWNTTTENTSLNISSNKSAFTEARDPICIGDNSYCGLVCYAGESCSPLEGDNVSRSMGSNVYPGTERKYTGEGTVYSGCEYNDTSYHPYYDGLHSTIETQSEGWVCSWEFEEGIYNKYKEEINATIHSGYTRYSVNPENHEPQPAYIYTYYSLGAGDPVETCVFDWFGGWDLKTCTEEETYQLYASQYNYYCPKGYSQLVEPQETFTRRVFYGPSDDPHLYWFDQNHLASRGKCCPAGTTYDGTLCNCPSGKIYDNTLRACVDGGAEYVS